MFSHKPSKKQGPSSASSLLQSHSPMTRKSPLARPTSQVLSKNIIKTHEPLPRALHTSSTANKSPQSLLPRKPSMLTSIRNLPGKKATRKPIKNTKENPACNKCANCKVIYGSKIDLLNKKQHGKQNAWIACDDEACDYWDHARCFEVVTTSTKNIQNIPFKCPLHA